MSSIPFTSFSTVKVHQTIKEQKKSSLFGSTQPTDKAGFKYSDRTQHKYNSKFMNSVWGFYNRYAPPAFQKNEELVGGCPRMTPQ